MKNLTLYLALIAVFASCAVPAPVVKLTPSTLQNKDYWNMGQQFVYATDKNIWFDCAFNRVENGKLIFNVKVDNQSDTAVLVDPVAFLQIIFKNDSVKWGQNLAYNPEQTLLNLQLSANESSARAKNATVFGITSAIIATGAIVAVATSKKDDVDKEDLVNTISFAGDVARTAAFATAESSNIRAADNWTMRKTLEEQFLRKTTLPKGCYIDGEVHFPYIQDARWYNIGLSAGNSKADFLFKQKLVYPPSQYGGTPAKSE
jgi:hypothetical protein